MTEQTSNPHEAEIREHFGKMLEYALSLRPGLSDVQFVGDQPLWTVAQKRTIHDSFVVDEKSILAWAEAFGAARGGLGTLNGPTGTLELAATVNGRRCRFAFRRQHNAIALTVRVLPAQIPDIQGDYYAINPVPAAVIEMVLDAKPGLGLIGGATESGKSTLLASLLQMFNQQQPGHIMTLEDPIEYLFEPNRSLISQREIPTDVNNFPQGILTAKRSNPRVLMIGELRDRETMRAAIDFAAQGHLVLATSHASSTLAAIGEMLGSFDSGEIGLVRQRLSQTLRFVLTQQLTPLRDGRVLPIRELLVGTASVRHAIATDAIGDLDRDVLNSSMQSQSFSFDKELKRLVDEQVISRGAGLQLASNQSGFAAWWGLRDEDVLAEIQAELDLNAPGVAHE